jgi:hypothetical protein
MPARSRLVSLLPWVLCTWGLTLLAMAAMLRLVLGGRSGVSDAEIIASVVEVLGFAGFPVVGAVIAARLPANSYGWVWCALGISYGVLSVAAAVAEGRALTGWWVTAVAYLAFLGVGGLLVLVFLLFPTGRMPSRRWRWLSRALVVLGLLLAAATPVAPSALGLDTRSPRPPGGAAGRLLADLVVAGVTAMFVLVLVAMAAVISRFRRAGPVERQQLKWFVWAAAVNAVYFLTDLVGVPVPRGAWVLVQVLAISSLPLAVGIAVLRYRLYEIDRIISRTVSWGLLTGGLIGLYLVLVTVLRPLLEPVTGNSSLAVAGSTLAVAAVFAPARRRLQSIVDRRFDRARYDAGRAVDAFAARLRNQVDLDEVTAGLRETVGATVAPTRIAVWLRVPTRPVGSR